MVSRPASAISLCPTAARRRGRLYSFGCQNGRGQQAYRLRSPAQAVRLGQVRTASSRYASLAKTAEEFLKLDLPRRPSAWLLRRLCGRFRIRRRAVRPFDASLDRVNGLVNPQPKRFAALQMGAALARTYWLLRPCPRRRAQGRGSQPRCVPLHRPRRAAPLASAPARRQCVAVGALQADRRLRWRGPAMVAATRSSSPIGSRCVPLSADCRAASGRALLASTTIRRFWRPTHRRSPQADSPRR